jgi:hypothetical protein
MLCRFGSVSFLVEIRCQAALLLIVVVRGEEAAFCLRLGIAGRVGLTLLGQLSSLVEAICCLAVQFKIGEGLSGSFLEAVPVEKGNSDWVFCGSHKVK